MQPVTIYATPSREPLYEFDVNQPFDIGLVSAVEPEPKGQGLYAVYHVNRYWLDPEDESQVISIDFLDSEKRGYRISLKDMLWNIAEDLDVEDYAIEWGLCSPKGKQILDRLGCFEDVTTKDRRAIDERDWSIPERERVMLFPEGFDYEKPDILTTEEEPDSLAGQPRYRRWWIFPEQNLTANSFEADDVTLVYFEKIEEGSETLWDFLSSVDREVGAETPDYECKTKAGEDWIDKIFPPDKGGDAPGS